jgi:hypothetical protein
MAYTSTTISLAIAEFLAHVAIDDLDPDTPPSLFYLNLTIPNASIRTLEQIGVELPSGWNRVPAPDVDAVIGDGWIRGGASLALVVPSVHVPIATPERNVLVNPAHRDFERVKWTVADFAYDERLARARAQAVTRAPARRRRS